MEEKAAEELSSGVEGVIEKEIFAVSLAGIPKAPSLGFNWLPKDCRRIVGEYISDDPRDATRRALLVGRRITLCLSQHSNLNLGPCWQLGCLSREDGWETSRGVRVNKTYLINDYQSCLDYLGRKSSPYYSLVIDVLIFQLDLSSQDISSALDDLQKALTELRTHLKSLQHVVFAIEEHVFCCFSFKDVIQTVDRQLALSQILGDLRTCWEANHKLTIKLLLDYYILKNVERASGMYLSKFVISVSQCSHRDLFDDVDPTLNSSKLRWIYSLETVDDFEYFNHRITRRCHAIHLNAFNHHVTLFLKGLKQLLCFKDNTLIERIVINSSYCCYDIQLPRPSAPLIDNTPCSALIELTLKGDSNTFDLTQLNNDYFPHLAHLCVLGGNITGRLDSHRVPSLKTLILELGTYNGRLSSNVKVLVRERTQSLIHSGLTWQLIATKEPGGWSLASYDEPTADPQEEEVKGDSLHSLPIIRELMLVMGTQEHADEWQSRLKGDPPLKAAIDDHNDGLLVWASDRVEKIFAYCNSLKNPRLKFKEEIPGQTRVLTSLTCHGIEVVLHGVALPRLQSLELNDCSVKMSGAFPQLQTLSFQEAKFQSRWQVNAPILKFLHCKNLSHGKRLSLHPELLPQLSYLRMELLRGDPKHCPTILVDEKNLGFSRNTHVVFGEGMTETPIFDECQVHRVLHLELAVDPLQPPACWKSTKWDCETLKLHFYAHEPGLLHSQRIKVIKVPPLLPQVRTLTVTEDGCPALLDSEMPNLTDLTVPSPIRFGPNLKCPALACIRFTKIYSEKDKEQCLDRATYEAMGARPGWVFFDRDGELKRMLWDIVPGATGVSSFAGPLEDGDDSIEN